MKKLLNTLYVTSADSYLALDGENVVILEKENELGRLPLHNLEAIISFGYRGTSPALMGACAERNVSLCYITPQGRFLARISGKTLHSNATSVATILFGTNKVYRNLSRCASTVYFF